jgi:hypothetical protein
VCRAHINRVSSTLFNPPPPPVPVPTVNTPPSYGQFAYSPMVAHTHINPQQHTHTHTGPLPRISVVCGRACRDGMQLGDPCSAETLATARSLAMPHSGHSNQSASSALGAPESRESPLWAHTIITCTLNVRSCAPCVDITAHNRCKHISCCRGRMDTWQDLISGYNRVLH